MRVLLQKNDTLGWEQKLLLNHCIVHDIPYLVVDGASILAKEIVLSDEDVMVGSVECVLSVLTQLGITLPAPETYPICLLPFLNRKIKKTNLNWIRKYLPINQRLFVKPAQLKLFDGMVIDSIDSLEVMAGITEKTPLYASEVVYWRSEHRVYVVEGEIAGIGQYKGDEDEVPDMEFVSGLVKAMLQNTSSRYFSLDIGIGDDGRCSLVEFNDAFALGAYKGISSKCYAAMILGRWNEIVNLSVKQVAESDASCTDTKFC